MNRKTPDEKFLIKLYEKAVEEQIDPLELGFKANATKTITKALAQANFIKKTGDGKIFITKHGIDFVQREL